MASEEDVDPLELLTEFLYLVPVGLMQFRLDGTVGLMNATVAQMLMPLSPNGGLADAYAALGPLVPDLARRARDAAGRTGVVLDHLRCEIAVEQRLSVLSVTVHAIHEGIFLAVLEDVTRTVEQERRLLNEHQRFRAILDNVRDYEIYTVDLQGRIEEWNQSMQRLGGWQPHDVVGRSLDLFFPREEREAGRFERLLAEARHTGSVETEGWLLTRHGSRLWANTVITALPDSTGAVRGFVVVSRDMTERKRMEDELRRLATTDGLTGILNRRQGQACLLDAFAAARDGSRPGVLMLDLDHFKSINDRHGHDAGDLALCAVARLCRDALADAGAAVRWGGEEFLLILPCTDADTALALAETLRDAIRGIQVPTAAGAIAVTASIGVAVGGGDGPQGLVRRADAALYGAKRSGRDCIVVSD